MRKFYLLVLDFQTFGGFCKITIIHIAHWNRLEILPALDVKEGREDLQVNRMQEAPILISAPSPCNVKGPRHYASSLCGWLWF